MKKIAALLLLHALFLFGHAEALAQRNGLYVVQDQFELFDGIAIPKLSKDKMLLKDDAGYKALLDVNKEININTQSDSIYKTLFFYDEKKPIEIIEKYHLNIGKRSKNDFKLQIQYKVRIKYFDNGKIRSYEVHLTEIGTLYNQLEVGTWYYFDRNGTLLRKVDYEKNYRTSLNDIFKIYWTLTEEDLFLKDDDSFLYKVGQVFSRFTNDVGESYWVLNLPEHTFVIDDKKGKIIEKVPSNEKEQYLSKYDKDPKTEKKTGYNVMDEFDLFDTVPVPKLSEDKMFFKNDKKYQKFYEKQRENNLFRIKIKNQFAQFDKELHFDDHLLTRIKEDYIVMAKMPQLYAVCNCISYSVNIDYHSNGVIKSYSVYANYLDQILFEIPVGTWYRFDKDGTVLSKVNIDQMYKTAYNDILKLGDKTLEKNKFGDATDIRRITRFINGDGNAYWIATYANKYSEIIDDKTGKVIEQSVEYESNDLLYKKYERNSMEYQLYKEFFSINK